MKTTNTTVEYRIERRIGKRWVAWSPSWTNINHSTESFQTWKSKRPFWKFRKVRVTTETTESVEVMP